MSLFAVNDKFGVICVQCDCTVNMKDQHIGLCKVLSLFDVRATMHLDKFLIINKLDAPISQIYFGMKLYMFWTVPLSISRSFSLYMQQWYMLYRFADSL